MRHFEVIATDGAARAGVLRTAHGEVQTPAFMPVGTKATVKSARSRRAADARGADHPRQHLPPALPARRRADRGARRPARASSGWDGPILTDSGGFQVFSLRDTLLAVDDDGVTFRSVYDGAPPASRRSWRPDPAQPRLGHRDVPRHLPARGRRRAPSSSGPCGRTTLWARRQREAERAPGQLALRDRAGRRPTRSCGAARSRRSSRSASTATRSAGSRSARAARRCSRRPDWAAPLLPADRPRYFMGIGDAEGILDVIERRDRHVRLRPADPDRPHRLGAHAGRPAQPAQRPLRPRPAAARGGLHCPACARFSRAYVRHLVNQEELLGLRLLSLHNLRFLLELTAGARAAIERGELECLHGRGARRARRRTTGGSWDS